MLRNKVKATIGFVLYLIMLATVFWIDRSDVDRVVGAIILLAQLAVVFSLIAAVNYLDARLQGLKAKNIMVRLSTSDFRELQRQAEDRGVNYESLARHFIKHGMSKKVGSVFSERRHS